MNERQHREILARASKEAVTANRDYYAVKSWATQAKAYLEKGNVDMAKRLLKMIEEYESD